MAYLSVQDIKRLGGVRPEMLVLLQQLMANFEARTGKQTFVAEYGGARTMDQQQALFDDRNAQGASYPVGTPGKSRHEFGGAVDLHIMGETVGNNIVDANNQYYQILAEEARAVGLKSGIGFSRPDPYHVELNESLADAQAAFAAYQKKKDLPSAVSPRSPCCSG